MSIMCKVTPRSEKMTIKIKTDRSSPEENNISSCSGHNTVLSSSPISIMNTINSREDKNNKIENVLVLQGRGSLGAFGCGVELSDILSLIIFNSPSANL
jgi:hypothetical protein